MKSEIKQVYFCRSCKGLFQALEVSKNGHTCPACDSDELKMFVLRPPKFKTYKVLNDQ